MATTRVDAATRRARRWLARQPKAVVCPEGTKPTCAHNIARLIRQTEARVRREDARMCEGEARFLADKGMWQQAGGANHCANMVRGLAHGAKPYSRRRVATAKAQAPRSGEDHPHDGAERMSRAEGQHGLTAHSAEKGRESDGVG